MKKKTDKQNLMSVVEVKSRAVRGLTLLVAREAVIKLIAIVGQLVLVRLLLPEYFGVVAIISFLINTGDLFSDIGLVSGVIRSEKKPSHDVLSSLFFVKFAMTFGIVVFLWVARPLLFTIFPALGTSNTLLLFVLSATLFVRPLRTMIYGLLERELRYDLIPIVDITGLLIYFVSACGLALTGFGIWSLVLSVVIKDTSEVVLLEFLHPFLPKLHFSWDEIRPFMKFGASLQGNTILGFLHQSTIPLLGGMLTTPTSVGLLDWSFNIASLPRAMSDNVGRIAFSSFSRIQGETALISRAIQETIGILSLIILFLITGALFFGREGIFYIIGDRWIDAAPSLVWLLVGELFICVAGVLQQAIIARGYTTQLLIRTAIGLIAQWAMAVLFVHLFGFVGIAMAISMGMALLSVLFWRLMRTSGVMPPPLLSFLPQFQVFLAACIVGLVLRNLPETFVWFVVKLVLFTLVYGVAVWGLARRTCLQTLYLLRDHIFS